MLNEGLEEIGMNAFRNAKLGTVAIPTTLTTLNANAFNANNNPDREDKKAVLTSTKYDQIKKSGNYTKVENNGTGNNGGGHIVVGDLSKASMAEVEDQDATGEAITPEPAITFDGQTLTKDTDYTLSYEANIEPGTAKITATGKGDGGTFVNALDGEFTILEKLEWTAECFTYSEDGATVTGLTDLGKKALKANPNMVIPDANADGVTTTIIGPGVSGQGTFTFTEEGEGDAFERTYTPTTVKLPAALEEIGNFAFCAATETTASPWQVKGLTTVDFPDTLKKIGNIAFQNAPLDKIVLPDSVTELGTGVFTGNEKIAAPKLSVLTISKGLKVIPDGTFTTRQIDAIVVPEGVETIGRNAFNGSLATSVSLPSTLKTIGRQAFNNHHFETVVIPAGVETIDQTAFRIVVGDFAGSGHTIKNLELNEGLKAIGKNAFQDACALETLPIPTTLTTLDSTAFSGNNNPNRTDKKVVLATLIEDQANAAGDYTKVVADGAGHIIELAAAEWTPACFTYDGATVTGLTSLGKTTLKAKDGALEIPNANADNVPTTIIGAGTPSTASKTQAGTFGYKAGDTWVYPKTVKFPEGLTEIGKFAFSGVYLTGTDPETGKATEEIVGGLTEVTLPNTLTTIGQAAFNWAQLTKVEIPDSVTSLGNGAFATAMTLPGTITEATLPANIETIPDSLFNNQELIAIEIPASVKTIQRNAFRENPIESLTIPENVETIGNCAFQNHALTELVIPASVKTIGNEAFNVSGHDGGTLASLTLNEGLESIGTRAFQGASLKEVEIPASLKTLKTYAFNNNKNEDREDSRVVLKSKVYAQAKGTGDYAKFVPDETFTTHHGGGHLTVLDFTSDQVTVGEIEDIVCFEEGEAKPDITVTWTDPDKTENTLVAETDYTVAFEGNTAEGEAKATITGAGPFVGEQTATFTIAGHDWDEGKFKGEGAKGEIVYTCKHNAEHTKSETMEDLVVKDGEQAMWIASKSADISAIASGLADGEVITKWTWEYSRDGEAWSKSGAKTFAGDGECTMVIPECTTARKPPMAWRATATTSLGRTATSAGQKLHVLEDLKVVPDPEGDFTWALDKDVVISAKVQGLAPNETVDTYTWYYSRDGKTFKRTGAKPALVGTDTLTLSGFKCTEARKAPMAWSVKVTTSTGRTYTSEGMSLTETA